MQPLGTQTILRLENLTRRLGKPLALGAMLSMGLVGCQSEGDGGGTGVQTVSLDAFDTCDDLLDYFQDEALTEVQHWGWMAQGRGEFDAVGAPSAEGGGAGGQGGGDTGNEAPVNPAFSGTNNQEINVDEPDLIKTDGRYVYGVRGRQLLIYQADDLTLLSETMLANYDGQILLDGDRLAVLYTDWQGLDALPEGVPERFLRSGKTVIEVYDVSERAAPVQLRRTLVEGQLVTARLVAGTARVVVHFDGANHVDWQPWGAGEGRGDVLTPPSAGGTGGASGGGSTGVDVEPDQGSDADGAPPEGMAERRDPQEVDAEAAWRLAIEETSIADWIPYRMDAAEGEATAGPIGACRQFHRPGEAAGHGVTAVISVDLDHPDAQFADPAVVTAPGVTYASAGNLYLTTVNHAGWLWGAGDVAVAEGGAAVGGVTTGGAEPSDTAVEVTPDDEGDTPGVPDGMGQRADGQAAAQQREASQIHKLSIADALAPAAYRASGRVFGSPLNQFSLGEHADHLRIATTENTMQGSTSNHLFVLGEAEGVLEVTGEINDIAETERIYAVRLMGERGFMVTFRQTDPLFTMDLSDPLNPQMVGELHIPGFSTYLHPLGAEHLIGIGQAADEAGRVTGMQLSLFDVSDFANPAQTHVQSLGEGWSNALYDHHAFTFWAPTGTLAIPVERWDDMDGRHTGLDLYGVSTEAGFSAEGFIAHDGFGDGWAPSIVRSLVIGDAIYAFSELGVTAHSLQGLAPLAEAAFPEDEGRWDGREPQPTEPGEPGSEPSPDDREAGDQGGADTP